MTKEEVKIEAREILTNVDALANKLDDLVNFPNSKVSLKELARLAAAIHWNIHDLVSKTNH